MSGNIAERVAGFLREQRGRAYCDDCLVGKAKLKRRQQANRVTMALAVTSDFARASGECAACHEPAKLVTRAR